MILRDSVVKTLEEAPPRSGRLYKIPGTRTQYRASAAHEVPAVRTGAYRSSWQFTPATVGEGVVSAVTFTDLTTPDGKWIIGRLLDEGTRHMAPREHVEKAVARAEKDIRKFLREIE